MLTATYFMLRNGVEYHDLGGRHFAERYKHETAKRLLRRLRDLGVEVEVKAAMTLKSINGRRSRVSL